MCLMPSNPESRALLNSERSKKFSLFLFVNNIVTTVVLILIMVAQDWSQVLFAVMSVVIGFCMLSERSQNIIKMDKLLCYVIISMYMTVVQFVHTTMLFVNAKIFNKIYATAEGADERWEVMLAKVSNTLLFVCFIFAAVVATLLYNHLRKNYQMAEPQPNQGGMFGNMFGGRQPNQQVQMGQRQGQQAPRYGAPVQSQAQSNTNTNSFVPFGGQSNRLGN